MRSAILLLVAGALAAKSVAAAEEILVVGDSWASFSNNLIEQYCVGSTVTNVAEVGSTAAAWAAGQIGEIPVKNFTKVWMALGGNDILFGGHSGCVRPPLAEDLQAVIAKVRSASPNAEILLTNYGWPSIVIPPAILCPNMGFETISEDIEAAVEAVNESSVVFLDVQYAFGAEPSTDAQPLSDPNLYFDWMHLNRDGYSVLFQLPEWMSFFCPDVEPQEASNTTLEDTEGSDVHTTEAVSSTVGLQAWVSLAVLMGAIVRK